MPPSRLLSAATRPLHLVPPGLGAVAAGGLLAAGLPPVAIAVGLLSVGTWGAMVAWDLLTPPPAPPPPPDPAETLQAPRLRALVGAVIEASERVRARLDDHPEALAAVAPELRAEEAALLEAAISAAKRGDAVWRLLQGVDPSALRREIGERRDAVQRTADPDVARSLQQAAEAKEREFNGWRDLAGIVDRIEADLVAADAALDELQVRVVKLALQEPGTGTGLEVRQQVKDLAERLHILERSAEATLREVG